MGESIRVSPVSGSVNVGETQEVKLSLKGPVDALNDKILVQAAILRDDTLGNAKDLWSKLSEREIQAQRLVVVVASNVPGGKPSSSGSAISVATDWFGGQCTARGVQQRTMPSLALSEGAVGQLLRLLRRRRWNRPGTGDQFGVGACRRSSTAAREWRSEGPGH